jgi:hypothetical protein
VIGVWNWLVQEGIYRDIVASITGVLVATVVAWHPFKRLRRSQIEINNNLDTTTPGGLTDVLKALNVSQASGASGPTSAPGDYGGS